MFSSSCHLCNYRDLLVPLDHTRSIRLSALEHIFIMEREIISFNTKSYGFLHLRAIDVPLAEWNTYRYVQSWSVWEKNFLVFTIHAWNYFIYLFGTLNYLRLSIMYIYKMQEI